MADADDAYVDVGEQIVARCNLLSQGLPMRLFLQRPTRRALKKAGFWQLIKFCFGFSRRRQPVTCDCNQLELRCCD